jgi:N-carbamoylputrescine amidase
MRTVKVAAIQFAMSQNPEDNLKKALILSDEAATGGADIILLPELFERVYFCQERRYEYLKYATPLQENPAVNAFRRFCRDRKTVVPVSFFERAGNVTYNSVAMIDADGAVLGVYRKTHIPDDHFYQEKFYFTPGNTGFIVFNTAFAKVGVGICWDQWFPETARCLAIKGAELILYPTAIGSEPILKTDSMGHWQRTMQGHAAANIVPVIAANRTGTERVSPCEENGGQSSALTFYGSSFMTDGTGAIVKSAGRDREEIITYEYDLDELMTERLEWGLFRDRRPECYKTISES